MMNNVHFFSLCVLRPDLDVINSVTPMLNEKTASNNVLLSISSVIHAYNVWASETDDKDTVIAAITSLEMVLNDTLTLNEDQDKVSVDLIQLFEMIKF